MLLLNFYVIHLCANVTRVFSRLVTRKVTRKVTSYQKLCERSICRKIFEKIFKFKMHYVGIFSKRFNKPNIPILLVWTNNAICRKVLRKFSKILKTFRKKIAKMHYFSIFFKNINKSCINILRVWTKNTN